MKTIMSFENGAVVLAEQGGDFFLNFDGSVGGGSMAGIISGQGSIKLGAGSVALKAAEAFLNHLLPASIASIAQGIEDALNAFVAKQ